MASLRESGWEAFQRGELDEAIRLLTLACQEDPSDYQAHLILGAVYGRKQQHDEAIAALISAVHLQPADALARYNLGVALEKAGHIDSAIEAFRQAVTLDPGYFKAKEALHRLDASVKPAVPISASTSSDPVSSALTYAPSEMHKTEEMAPAARLASDDGPGWSAPLPQAPPRTFIANSPVHSAANASGGGTDADRPDGAESPGFVSRAAATTAALPSHGLLSEYTPSPHAPDGPTATFESYEGGLPPPNYNDEIDIPKAFRDFGRILVTPNRLLNEQAQTNGMMSPILMVGVYLVIQLVSGMIRNGVSGVFGFVTGLIFSPMSLAVAGAWMVFWYLMSALAMHFLGYLFGNRQDYSMSFKAVVYADAPSFLVTILLSIYLTVFVMPAFLAHPITDADIDRAMGLPPGTTARAHTTQDDGAPFPMSKPANAAPTPAAAPTARTAQPNPTPESVLRLLSLIWNRIGALVVSSAVLYTIGWTWSTVLLVLGIHRLQKISPAAAIAVVFLAYALCIMAILVLIFGFAGACFALINWAIHASGAAGGAVHH